MEFEERERAYGREEYYWGTEPNELAERVIELLGDPGGLRLVDLGAGEGRDAVFFAEQGLEAWAVDVSPAGLRKAERLADERGVEIHACRADANEFALPRGTDVVYSIGTLQYVRPGNRDRQFERFKRDTAPGGLHATFAFVDHPDVPTPPDWTASEHFYAPGELRGYYDGWEVLAEESLRFEDDSGGEPHEHAAEQVIARKPA